MVTCKLIGRLGNQMFQTAAAYAHALRNGYEFRYPVRSENEALWPSHRQLKFGKPCHPNTAIWEYQEMTHSYKPIPAVDNIRLNGYFQSEKYFADYRTEILEAFGLNNLPRIDGVVALHVRRGDYTTLPNHHPVIDSYYIENAVKEFYHTNVQKIMLFSDDIEWCKQHITGYFDDDVIYIKQGDPFGDLKIMASCEHQIISNSSYSWWAAWANPNPRKHIIAPSKWFGPANAHLETKDIIPPTWKII